MSDSEKQETTDVVNATKLVATPKAIRISLQADNGNVEPVEIDEIEEVIAHARSVEEDDLQRSHSISDRIEKLKKGEDRVEMVKREAVQRKETFRQLLDDHEEIVKVVNSIKPQAKQ